MTTDTRPDTSSRPAASVSGFAGLLLDLDTRPGPLRSVLIHPAGGGLLPYLAVASHLARRGPVAAIRGAGLIGDETPHDDIAEMADGYAGLLAAGQHPDLLFGWSMGGTLAWEVAARLGRGGAAAAVVMVDSMAEPPDASGGEWAAARRAILSGIADADRAADGQIARTVDAHLTAVLRHRATPAPATRALLMACGPKPDVRERLGDWPGRAPGLAVTRLPGEHFDVFTPTVLPALLAHLDAFVDELMEGEPR